MQMNKRALDLIDEQLYDPYTLEPKPFFDMDYGTIYEKQYGIDLRKLNFVTRARIVRYCSKIGMDIDFFVDLVLDEFFYQILPNLPEFDKSAIDYMRYLRDDERFVDFRKKLSTFRGVNVILRNGRVVTSESKYSRKLGKPEFAHEDKTPINYTFEPDMLTFTGKIKYSHNDTPQIKAKRRWIGERLPTFFDDYTRNIIIETLLTSHKNDMKRDLAKWIAWGESQHKEVEKRWQELRRSKKSMNGRHTSKK